jgi:hypothetical protein
VFYDASPVERQARELALAYGLGHLVRQSSDGRTVTGSTSGIVDWDQCRPGSSGYALGCALLQDEVNAATGERAARIVGDNLLRVYQSFVAVTYLTRQAGGR